MESVVKKMGLGFRQVVPLSWTRIFFIYATFLAYLMIIKPILRLILCTQKFKFEYPIHHLVWNNKKNQR